jgi:hypothetical protein
MIVLSFKDKSQINPIEERVKSDGFSESSGPLFIKKNSYKPLKPDFSSS